MADEDLPPEPDNAAFKKAIDNIFKKVARRRKDHAEGAALRAREARKRANDAKSRQRRRR